MKNLTQILVTLLITFAAASRTSAQEGTSGAVKVPNPTPARDRPSAPAEPVAAERDRYTWREFSSDGRFTVLLPGTPELATREIPAPGGKMVPLHIHSLRTSAEYGVIYADYPFEVTGAEMKRRLLDDGVRGAVDSVGSELLDLKEVSLGEHPGRALRERMRDGRIMHARMYLVGSRLYQIAVTLPNLDTAGAAAAFGEEVAAKFLGSFRLLEPGGGDGEVDRFLRSLRERRDEGPAVYVVGDASPPEPAGEHARAVTGGVLSGRAVSKPQPAYPPIARAARAQGSVVVWIVVDEKGEVVAAQAASGHLLLQAAAVKAARAARFSPTRLDGTPVKVFGSVTYNFVLQ